MTAAQFRKIALSLEDTEERSHMGHPDFRKSGKIFATLGYPDKTRAMVKLSPEEQKAFVQRAPDAFVPVKGAWGASGSTSVLLKHADPEMVGEALTVAWRLVPTAKRKPR
jgi:YjbR